MLFRSLHYDTRLPDLAFYIQVDGETLLKRNLYRSDGRIIHFQSSAGINRLLYYYEQIALDENIIRINGNYQPENTLSSILNVLDDHCLSPKKYTVNTKK